MTWRRGFLRLWLVLTALWLIAWLVMSDTGTMVIRSTSSGYLDADADASAITLEEMDGSIATFAFHGDDQTSWIGGNWWRDDPRILAFHTSGVRPEMQSEWEGVLEAVALQFNDRANEWNAVLRAQRKSAIEGLFIAGVVPLLALAIGLCIGWVIAGFRKKKL